MHVYVCMYMYMYAHAAVCIRVCMRIQLCVHVEKKRVCESMQHVSVPPSLMPCD
jgi:hypothetical protein